MVAEDAAVSHVKKIAVAVEIVDTITLDMVADVEDIYSYQLSYSYVAVVVITLEDVILLEVDSIKALMLWADAARLQEGGEYKCQRKKIDVVVKKYAVAQVIMLVMAEMDAVEVNLQD